MKRKLAHKLTVYGQYYQVLAQLLSFCRFEKKYLENIIKMHSSSSSWHAKKKLRNEIFQFEIKCIEGFLKSTYRGIFQFDTNRAQ